MKRFLNVIEVEVCQELGVSPDDYQQTLETEAKNEAAINSLSSDELAICNAFGVEPKDYESSLK